MRPRPGRGRYKRSDWAPREVLACVGNGNRFGVVDFGFDVGNIAFCEIVEELVRAVFMLHLRKNSFE